MRYEWIEELEKLYQEKEGNYLFRCPFCEGKWTVKYFENYLFECVKCGFIFEVPDQILIELYEEVKE